MFCGGGVDELPEERLGSGARDARVQLAVYIEGEIMLVALYRLD